MKKFEYIKEASPFGSLRQIPEMVEPKYSDYETTKTTGIFMVDYRCYEKDKRKYKEELSRMPLYPLSLQPSNEWMQRKEYEPIEDFVTTTETIMDPFGGETTETFAIPIEKKGDDLVASQNHPQPESSVATLACTVGNSIEQGNKLIAEFIGLKIRSVKCNGPFDPEEWDLEIDAPDFLSDEDLEYIYELDGPLESYYEKLKFDTSWEWLMPVVEKIQELGYDVHIYGEANKGLSAWSYCDIIKDGVFIWEGVHEKSKIKTTWQAVTEFIKWLNSEQEQERSVATMPNQGTTVKDKKPPSK
jgi:hypothetical protein